LIFKLAKPIPAARHLSDPWLVAEGGLMALRRGQRDLFAQAATYVDRILHGQNQANWRSAFRQIRLVVNLKPPGRSASKSRRSCSPAPPKSSNEASNERYWIIHR